MARQYSQAEVDALMARANGGSDLDAIAAREYHVIAADDGQVLAWPPAHSAAAVPGHNGPLTLNGEHPDDYYGIARDDNGKAKLNDKGQAVATKNV